MHLTYFWFAGIPLPKVTWWTGGALYDSSDEVTRSGVIVNRMVYKDLQRQDLGKKFLCQAANTNLTIPVSREVKVLLNCKFIFPYFLIKVFRIDVVFVNCFLLISIYSKFH
jgi:hypothetical protein